MKRISRFTAVLMFLAIFGSNGTKLVAQRYIPNVPNAVLTTDCCPRQKQKVDSIINNAPFVFEGRVIKIMNGRFQLYYLFEIEKVYRGGERLQAGTVEIVSRGVEETWTPPVSLANRRYIIFAKEIESGGAFDANNPIKLDLFYSEYSEQTSRDYNFFNSMFVEYSNGEAVSREFSHYYTGFSSLFIDEYALRFGTKKALLDFFATYGLFPTDMPKADTLKNLSYREIEEARQWQENVDKYHKTPEQRDSLKQERNRRLGFDLDSVLIKKKAEKKLNQHKRGGSDPNLFLTVDNIRFTENTGNRFLEFDVMGRADTTGTYPYYIGLVLNYESDALNQPFGKNTSDVVVTNGTYFTGGNYDFDYWINTGTNNSSIWVTIEDYEDSTSVLNPDYALERKGIFIG